MASSRLPYPWKLLVAAAVIALLIMGVKEGRKQWQKRQPSAVAPLPPEFIPEPQYADTLARVREIIALHLASSPEIVTPAMPLADLGFDAYSRIEVADALETAFRIELRAEEFTGIETVEDLAQLVWKKQQEKTGR